MLELVAGLSEDQLEAIRGLERRVVRLDGGRLKLEWGILERRPAKEVNDLLWWEGPTLAGFLGIYGYGGATLELAGMVDPQWRRRGIGGALLERALTLSRERSTTAPLLVVPRESVGGRALALARGGRLEHSEHALELHEPPVEVGSQAGSEAGSEAGSKAGSRAGSEGRVALRDTVEADRETLSALMLDGFGDGELDDRRPLHDDHTRTLMVTLGEATVGTLRLDFGGARAGVYGFVIAAPYRGRGYGAQALQTACLELFRGGTEVVGLEVAVENERALKLYTDLGFQPVTTEDYYQMR